MAGDRAECFSAECRMGVSHSISSSCDAAVPSRILN
jgi:hypothetical protein